MAKGKILVVDDDSNLLEVIKMRLESSGYEVVTALRENDAIDEVKKSFYDLSVIDLQLAEMDGISLMTAFQEINPEMPVIILTAHGTIESAVEAMKRGAYSYLTKPFDHRELLFQIEKVVENRRLTSEIQRLRGLLEEKYDFDNIVAKSKKMQDILSQLAIIARRESTVFIYGESGTGKELVARAIHLSSNRKDKPFIAMNCAAIPDNILESELFGVIANYPGFHNKAALKGKFELADGGTLFLDEIGDMPLTLQSKMLRILQEQQFYILGGNKPLEVDVRVIIATNKNLQKEVKKGTFREDLYYRIHVVPIELPPLRERREDIPSLVSHFLEEFNQKMKIKVKGLTPQAMQKLMLYDWPGNVRELKNTIEFSMALTQKDVISEDLILKTNTELPDKLKSFKEAKSEFEKEYLLNLLKLTQGNVSRASDIAGKYRADFYQLLKKYELRPHQFKK